MNYELFRTFARKSCPWPLNTPIVKNSGTHGRMQQASCWLWLLVSCFSWSPFRATVRGHDGVWDYIFSVCWARMFRRRSITPCHDVRRHWDHAAIYWHIAGSYSPLTLTALLQTNYQLSIINCQLSVGWSLFSFVWLCAIAGTIVSFVRLKEHSNLETFCFIGMGLSVLVAFKPLIDSVSTAAVIWIIAEGVCYITGALFYTFHKKRYMHSIFHFFVLAGSICHIIAVWDVLMMSLSGGQ